MANMIEQSLLCKVLDAPDLEILHSNGVVEEMFLTCKDEIHFIIVKVKSFAPRQIQRRLFAALVTFSRKVFRPWHKWF